ncbi:hypothetical protein PUV47_04555 [Pseudovibrio exalbescens]|uniref:hypothetical protein n=1 Tax=Pseudovibrio exalbescens TaxID=197461 RepID=UPI002366C4FE|nr:hypothetical protein [Pseudovibrio exalbescens]MDD7909177.1 hypothetical protein [Pseudovibrio exalbescens]
MTKSPILLAALAAFCFAPSVQASDLYRNPASPHVAYFFKPAEYPFNFLLPNDMQSRPRVYGTEFDCRIRVQQDGPENVYQAFVTGRFTDHPSRFISSVACFQTAQKCDAYLNFMRGYLQLVNSAACQRGYYQGLFN